MPSDYPVTNPQSAGIHAREVLYRTRVICNAWQFVFELSEFVLLTASSMLDYGSRGLRNSTLGMCVVWSNQHHKTTRVPTNTAVVWCTWQLAKNLSLKQLYSNEQLALAQLLAEAVHVNSRNEEELLKVKDTVRLLEEMFVMKTSPLS